MSKLLVGSFNVSRLLANHVPSCKGMLHLPCSGGSRGEARGACPPPLIFRPNCGPKGRKTFFETAPPPSLSEGLDPPLRWYWEPSVCTTAEFQPKLGNSFMSKCCHKVLQMHRCQSVKKETLNRFCLYYNTCTESSREAKINKSVKGC